MRRAVAVLASLMFVVACDSSSEPKIPDFDGRWDGEVQGVSLTITAHENSDSEISGSGTFAGPGGSFAFSIAGVHSHPNVSFTGTATGYEDFNFSGRFATGDDDTVSGTLNGSGFVNESVTLRR